jgi:pimeloyl-ACP methyl ester carboxylesterase
MPTLQTNGIELYYEAAGEGEPLVLLHGLGSRSEDWQLQVPDFARRYRVITADMRGHGRTSKPPGPYSVPMMAADVTGLLDALDVDAAHLVGLSMGGMIAFQFGVDRPERVRSLVIVNSGPALVARTLKERWQVAQRLALARLLGPGRTAVFLSQRLFPKTEQADLREQFIAQWTQNDRHAYLAAMRALVGWSVLDRVGALRCPTLVISGDRDYTPVETKRAYTALIPGARLEVVADSGHATPIDQAERFNELVLTFLAEKERER